MRAPHRPTSTSHGPRNKLIVTNLSPSTTADDLRKAFRKYGPLKNVRITGSESVNETASSVTTDQEDTPSSYGVVEFHDETSAQKALRADGSLLNEYRMKVVISSDPNIDHNIAPQLSDALSHKRLSVQSDFSAISEDYQYMVGEDRSVLSSEPPLNLKISTVDATPSQSRGGSRSRSASNASAASFSGIINPPTAANTGSPIRSLFSRLRSNSSRASNTQTQIPGAPQNREFLEFLTR